MKMPLTVIGLVIVVTGLAYQVQLLRSDVERLRKATLPAEASFVWPGDQPLPTGYCTSTNPPRCYP